VLIINRVHGALDRRNCGEFCANVGILYDRARFVPAVEALVEFKVFALRVVD